MAKSDSEGTLDITELPKATLKRLLEHGILISVKEDAGGKLELITGGILVNSPPEDVYELITDYDSYAEFMPSLTKAEVVHRSKDGRTLHVRYVLKLKLAAISTSVKYTVKLTLDPKSYEVRWDLLKGDMKETKGGWKLVPLDGGKRVALFYSVYSDIGSINWITKKAVESIPGIEVAINSSTCELVLKAVKSRMEGGR